MLFVLMRTEYPAASIPQPLWYLVRTGFTGRERGKAIAVKIALLGRMLSAQISTSYPSVSCHSTGVSLFTFASVMAYHTMPFAV